MHRLFCSFYITWTLNKEKKLIRKFLKSFQKDILYNFAQLNITQTITIKIDDQA